MISNKEGEKDRLLKWCIGGDINQSQSCNVDVKQPNNNVICSNDTETNQIVSEANEEIREEVNKEDEQLNLKKNKNSSGGKINQSANCIQNVEQPESNVYNADSSTIRQNNKGKRK